MENELRTDYTWEYYDLFGLIKTVRNRGVGKLTVSRVGREISRH